MKNVDPRHRAEDQAKEMLRLASEARNAARKVSPADAQALLLKAHNLEVIARGLVPEPSSLEA